MSSVIIGVLAGLYLGNHQVRATVDAQIKKAVGVGIDALNGKPPLIDLPQEAIKEE